MIERRAVYRRVPRADAAELATRFGHVVEVLPTLDRGVYRLTARGYAGWFATKSVQWVVRPKLPWADLSRLVTGVDPLPAARGSDLPGAFVDLVAGRLAILMRERSVAGLHHDYRETATDSTEVRGRIDFAEQARRPTVGTLPIVADEFTPANAFNLIPTAAARLLINRPELSATIRSELASAAALFPAIDTPPDQILWDTIAYDARTEPYRRLIDWCQLVRSAVAPGTGNGFLVNLEQLFQCHVGTILDSPLVTPQARIALDPVRGPLPLLELRPDFLTPDAVWDAKWKPLRASGPEPTDIQQVLAYATAVGVRTAGLIYPGRSPTIGECRTATGVRLLVVRLRLAGPAERIVQSAKRFRRLVLGRSGGED